MKLTYFSLNQWSCDVYQICNEVIPMEDLICLYRQFLKLNQADDVSLSIRAAEEEEENEKRKALLYAIDSSSY